MEMEIAVELLRDKRFVQLKSELAEMNPADIASFVAGMAEFDEFGDRELTLLFRILPKEKRHLRMKQFLFQWRFRRDGRQKQSKKTEDT